MSPNDPSSATAEQKAQIANRDANGCSLERMVRCLFSNHPMTKKAWTIILASLFVGALSVTHSLLPSNDKIHRIWTASTNPEESKSQNLVQQPTTSETNLNLSDGKAVNHEK
jgi:hypothetical protein